MNAGRKKLNSLPSAYCITICKRIEEKTIFCLLVKITFHHIVNLPLDFDMFPIVKPAFLLGGKIKPDVGSTDERHSATDAHKTFNLLSAKSL